MHKKHFFLLILCLFVLVSCTKEQKKLAKLPAPSLQEVQKQATIDSLIKLIAEYNCLDGEATGYGGNESEQYKHYRMLKSLIKEEQAILLTNHPNKVVKCYAFDILVANKSDSVFQVLQRHLNDTTKVGIRNGCLGYEIPTREHFLNALSALPLEKPTKRDSLTATL